MKGFNDRINSSVPRPGPKKAGPQQRKQKLAMQTKGDAGQGQALRW